MSLQHVLAIVLAAICTVTDIRQRKIYNVVTLPAMGVGLALSLVLGGLRSALQSAGGILVGFVIGLILVSIQALFGGDLKLLMALGSFVGPKAIIHIVLLGIVLLGIQGVFTLLTKGALRRTAENMLRWAFLTWNGSKVPLAKSGITMPAAPAFLLATIITVLKGGL